MKKVLLCLIVLISVANVNSQVFTDKGYKIVNKFPLEGNEKWDYLYSDDLTGLLYVSHGTMVQVVDESQGKVIGTITGLKGVHGIAIAPSLNKGFISSGKDSSVTVFDTKSFKTITRILVTGVGPDAILYDPFSKKVFVYNGKSNNATVISAENDKILATIPLNGKPEFSVSDGKGKIYVNFEDKSSIAVINPSTYKVENVWSLLPGTEPTGLAIDIENHRLFSVCANKLMVIVDADNGKVVKSVPIGEKPDAAAFDPVLKCAYSSNGEGTLTIVKENNKDSFKVLDNFKTQKGAKTMTINKKTHHIYLPVCNFETQQGKEKPKIVPGTFVVMDIVSP